MTPTWVAAILDSRAFQLFARVALVVTFVVPGIMQPLQFQGTIGEFQHFNVNPAAPFIVLSFVTLLVGSALVVLGGKWTWLGAGALGIYTFLTIFIAHHFWTMSGDERLSEMRQTLEHVSLIGGLMMVAIAQNGRRPGAAAG